MSENSAPAATLSGDTTLELPEFDSPPVEPLLLLRQWLDGAVRRGVREPFAAVLATGDAAGRPSTRVLLLKELDDRGLVFSGSQGSRKGRDLIARPVASMTFYWRETLQQLTVTGPVETLTVKESDQLFAERPRTAQAASAVSRQSRPLTDEAALRDRAHAVVADDGPVPRPTDWTGYRLLPESVEFWYGSPDRLHRRLYYERADHDADGWTRHRLQP